jgi:hypothetical protein
VNGVSLAGGFVVLEDVPEEEKNAHAEWLRRGFAAVIGSAGAGQAADLAELTTPDVAALADGEIVDAWTRRFPGGHE